MRLACENGEARGSDDDADDKVGGIERRRAYAFMASHFPVPYDLSVPCILTQLPFHTPTI